MARTMQRYVDDYESVPVLILACFVRYRDTSHTDGASVYPACQNLLLAARALGYGGVMTEWQSAVDAELRALLRIPDGVELMATITLGRPEGRHGPVRRRPLPELVFGERWGEAPAWAVDPAGHGAHCGGAAQAGPANTVWVSAHPHRGKADPCPPRRLARLRRRQPLLRGARRVHPPPRPGARAPGDPVGRDRRPPLPRRWAAGSAAPSPTRPSTRSHRPARWSTTSGATPTAVPCTS